MQDRELPGDFIVIEGPDGSGTTTQAEKLAEELDAYYTAEPTSGKAGEKVEEMITSGDYSAEAIALMFAADRLDHLEEEIIPRLENGETVVCDRYYHSSFVYQPALGAEFDWVMELNRSALRPDITLVLDISSEKTMERIEKRENEVTEDTVPDYDRSQASLGHFTSGENIFENLSFQQKVIRGYHRLPEQLDEDIYLVDSEQEVADVFEDILSLVKKHLGIS